MTTQDKAKKSMLFVKYFMFAVYGTISVLITFFPVYLKENGFDHMEIGMIMAGGPIISLIANPLWAYWSDRSQNIRRILLIMLMSNLLVVQAVFQFEQFLLIYVAMLILFFFQTPIFSLGNSLILNEIEGTKHQFGSFRSWGSLGWALMAVVAAPVIQWMGITKLQIVYSIIMIITILFAFGLPRGEGNATAAVVKPRFKDIYSNPLFVIFLLIGVIISLPNAVNGMFLSIYINDLGGSENMIAWAVFSAAAFEIPIFILMDRYLKKRVNFMLSMLFVISLLFAGRWMLMSMVTSAWQILLIQMTHSITFAAYYYIGTQLTSMFVPAQFRASGQAAYTLGWNGIAGILAGFVGGWMLEFWGARLTYQTGAMLSMLGAAGFGWLMYSYRKNAAKQQSEA